MKKMEYCLSCIYLSMSFHSYLLGSTCIKMFVFKCFRKSLMILTTMELWQILRQPASTKIHKTYKNNFFFRELDRKHRELRISTKNTPKQDNLCCRNNKFKVSASNKIKTLRLQELYIKHWELQFQQKVLSVYSKQDDQKYFLQTKSEHRYL